MRLAVPVALNNAAQLACFMQAGFVSKASTQDPVLCLRRLIENLDYKVNDDDIKELFEPFGGLKYSSVHWGNECVPQTHA